MAVLVFKTNIQRKSQAIKIKKMLAEQLPKHRINFDLDDCDKILRVEGNDMHETKIVEQVLAQGFELILL